MFYGFMGFLIFSPKTKKIGKSIDIMSSKHYYRKVVHLATLIIIRFYIICVHAYVLRNVISFFKNITFNIMLNLKTL